jgi:general secretion pathway protein G
MRKAIDACYADTKHYPQHLSTLVPQYLRRIPVDPITRSAATWIEVHDDGDGVVDVRSGAAGNASDGTPYRSR